MPSRRPKKIHRETAVLQTDLGDIPYLLTRSSARRTLAIYVDEKAQVSIAVPFRSKDMEVQTFINEKMDWILEKVRTARVNYALVSKKVFDHGHQFLFLGAKHRLDIREGDIKRVRLNFDGSKWLVEIPQKLTQVQRQKMVKSKLTQWYRQQAQEVLGGRVFHYARIMDLWPGKLAIRSHKRIWGNCDYNTRVIHLNWQLILTPMSVIDYVVVHELCHLLVPNHSRRFWTKVKKVMPDYDKQKTWLKMNTFDLILP